MAHAIALCSELLDTGASIVPPTAAFLQTIMFGILGFLEISIGDLGYIIMSSKVPSKN
jgi:hypothetical protein